MQTADDSFESAEYLATFSSTETNELNTLLEAFVRDHPPTMVKKLNPKTGNVDFKFRTVEPPYVVRGKASNVVKNLRDALDQAVYAASWKVNRKPSQFTHFPFGSNPDDFAVAITRNRSKDIPAKLHPILKSFEPYPTGNGYAGGDNMLRMLGRISGPNKHNVTLIVSRDVQSMAFTIPDGGMKLNPGSQLFPYLADGSAKNEFEVLSLAPGSDFKGDMKFDATFYVAFSHPQLRNVPAINFLQYCCRRVAKIVQDLRAEAVLLHA